MATGAAVLARGSVCVCVCVCVAMTRRLKVQLVALFGICVAAYAWNVVSPSPAMLCGVRVRVQRVRACV